MRASATARAFASFSPPPPLSRPAPDPAETAPAATAPAAAGCLGGLKLPGGGAGGIAFAAVSRTLARLAASRNAALPVDALRHGGPPAAAKQRR